MASERPAAADLDAFKSELDDISHGFNEADQTEDGLVALRQRLTPLRDQIRDHAAALEPRLKLITDRLKRAGRGIILLHDPKAHTAAMLPAFLSYLRDNHYRVVHLLPAGPAVRFSGAP